MGNTFSSEEIVVVHGEVINAKKFLELILSFCEDLSGGNNELPIDVNKLYDYILRKLRNQYKEDMIEISMHISTAKKMDKIVTSKFKIFNNNSKCINFKNNSKKRVILWKKDYSAYDQCKFSNIHKISDIVYFNDKEKGTNPIGIVTQVGLFLFEVEISNIYKPLN